MSEPVYDAYMAILGPGSAAAPAAPTVDDDRKRYMGAASRAALLGIQLDRIRLDLGGWQYIAIKAAWGMSRGFDELSECEAWLDRLEGRG